MICNAPTLNYEMPVVWNRQFQRISDHCPKDLEKSLTFYLYVPEPDDPLYFRDFHCSHTVHELINDTIHALLKNGLNEKMRHATTQFQLLSCSQDTNDLL